MENPGSQKSASYVYFITFVAAIGGFIFGYDLNVIGPGILILKQFFALPDQQVAWGMSSANWGCAVGPIFGMLLCDGPLGRKWTLMLAAVIVLISVFGTALADTFSVFNYYRILGGLGVGMSSMISPMYIAEISPARIRGKLVTMNQLAIVVGSLSAIVVAYYLEPSQSGLAVESSWRLLFGSVALPILCLMVGLLVIPPSPRWLVQRGLIDRARTVLTNVEGPQRADEEIALIRETLTEESGTFSELFSPGIRRAAIIAMGLSFFAQWCGISTIAQYAPVIYQKAGYTDPSAAIAQTIWLSVFNTVITIISLLVVDKLGRRPLLLLSCVGMALSQFMLGYCFISNRGFLTVIVMYCGMASYIGGLAALGWLIMSEIFPNRIRAKGMMAATIVGWLSTGASNYFLGDTMSFFEKKYGSPGGVFMIYGCICVACFFFSYMLVPETKQKTLEEISLSFLHPSRK